MGGPTVNSKPDKTQTQSRAEFHSLLVYVFFTNELIVIGSDITSSLAPVEKGLLPFIQVRKKLSFRGLLLIWNILVYLSERWASEFIFYKLRDVIESVPS